MKKKWSLLLVFALLIGICFSVPVSANEDNGEVAGEITETTTETGTGTEIETETETTEPEVDEGIVVREPFTFKLNEDGTGYILIGYNATDGDNAVDIPSYVQGDFPLLPVVEIDTEAFKNVNVVSITIPKTVQKMTGDGFHYKTKTKVYISSLYSWCEIDFYSNTSNPLYTLLGSGSELYLNDTLVKDLVIPDGITEIKSHAFTNCDSIKTVTISKSVKKIGVNAFGSNQNLQHIYYVETEENVAAIEISDDAFSDVENIKFHFDMASHNISYDYDKFEAMGCKEPTCTENGKAYAQCSCGYTWFETVDPLYHKFENERCVKCGISAWNYSVDDSQKTVTVNRYLDNVDSVLVFPSEIDGYTVTSINNFLYNFQSPSIIETVVIPDTVKSITGTFNFVGFSGLKRLVIPESVIEIADNMLNYTGGTDITIYGVSGSKAEEYAIAKGFSFVDISTIYSIDTETTEVTDGMLIVDEVKETEIANLLKPSEDYIVSVVPTEYNIYSTGTKVQIKDKDGAVLKEHVLVVKGDLNGDGVCDALDCMLVELARTNSANLAKSAFLAGNLTDDSEITIDDFEAIVNKAIN